MGAKGKMAWEYSMYSHRVLLGTQWRNLGSIASELESSQSGWLSSLRWESAHLNTSALYVELLSAVGYRSCALFIMQKIFQIL